MTSISDCTALLVVVGCLVLIGVQGASVEDRFLPHFMASDDAPVAVTSVSNSNAASSASTSGAAVNDSPIIISHGSPGKKVQITITKEITGHQGHDHNMIAAVPHEPHRPHTAQVASTSAHAPHGHNHVHEPHGAHAQVAGTLSQLDLSNDPGLVVDNETMAGLLQQMLAGNIQNVESHGRPLAVPPGGKPVAVIFSSSMHVVDLGDLRPPTTRAPSVTVTHTHSPHSPHGAHGHNHTHGTHPGLNHTSLLESLMSPLFSLTHVGGLNTHQTHPPQQPQQPIATVAATPMQPVQMQPIVMMMPVSQMQTLPVSQMQIQSVPISASASSSIASAPFPVDSLPQLGNILQGILTAKQQLINSTLLAGHGPHHAHVSGTHSSMVTASPPVIRAPSNVSVLTTRPPL